MRTRHSGARRARARRARRARVRARPLGHEGPRARPDARLPRARLRRAERARLRGDVHEPQRRHGALAGLRVRRRRDARALVDGAAASASTRPTASRSPRATAPGASCCSTSRRRARSCSTARTGEQTTYAAFPDGAIPNYAAWGPDGSLYVTDYGRRRRLADPAAAAASRSEWLRDARLDGGEFGTTGLELARRPADAARRRAVAGRVGPAALNPSTGRLFTVADPARRHAGRADPALGEPARRRARRLRHRAVGRDLHVAARGQPARGDRGRTGRSASASPRCPAAATTAARSRSTRPRT